MVKNCDLCNKHQPAQLKLPIMQPDLPTRPWEKLGTEIFKFNGKKYLMVVDYYSWFPVIRRLNGMTSTAEYGLLATIIPDFGSQYRSKVQIKMWTKWHQTTLQFSISPSSKQPSRKSIWNLQITLEKGTGGEWMPLQSPMDTSHNSTWWPDSITQWVTVLTWTHTTFPSSRSTLKSKHPDNGLHQIYLRTWEHLRPRSQSEITPPVKHTSPPVGAVAYNINS